MATQPTQNQVPSESPRDLKFNAGKIDEFVNSLEQQYIDRFGGRHYTIEGLRWLAQQAIAQFGYITIDSFQAGATISLPNHVRHHVNSGFINPTFVGTIDQPTDCLQNPCPRIEYSTYPPSWV